MIVLNNHLLGGGTISMAAVCTIILRVVAHGISANPLVAALGARVKNYVSKTVVNQQDGGVSS